MVDISFEIAGWEVDPDKLGHALGRSVLRTIRKSISNRVGYVRCPEHGSTPKIIIKGPCLADLSWEIFGCCRRLTEAVEEKLAGRVGQMTEVEPLAQEPDAADSRSVG
jgi:hypothetical protein